MKVSMRSPKKKAWPLPAGSRKTPPNGKKSTAPRRALTKKEAIVPRLEKALWPQASYEAYRLTGKEILFIMLAGILAGELLGLLFFRHAAGLLTALPFSYGLLRLAMHKKTGAVRRKLTLQLRDYLLSVTAFLRAGYALENAMSGAEKEMVTMHGEESLIAREARQMSREVGLHVSAEAIWRSFGERTGLPEGLRLSRIFAVAKRQGGDYLPVLAAMVRAMEAKRSLREEIETLLASQRLEYLIMCLVPAGILFYLNMTAPELTAYLYRGSGRLVMLGALALYLTAVLLGEKILEKAYGS